MPNTAKTTDKPVADKGKSKLDRLIMLLRDPGGATMPAMIEATAWQAHSIRGAIAGSLRKKGHKVESAATDGGRVWRIIEAAQ